MHGRLGLYLPYLTLQISRDNSRRSRPFGPHNAITSLVAAEISPIKTNLPLFPVVISNNRSRGQMTTHFHSFISIIARIIVFPLLGRFPLHPPIPVPSIDPPSAIHKQGYSTM